MSTSTGARMIHLSGTKRNPPRADMIARDGDPLYKPRDAARYLSMSVRQLADRSDIPVVNIARAGARRRQVRYRKSALDRFIAAHEQPTSRSAE